MPWPKRRAGQACDCPGCGLSQLVVEYGANGFCVNCKADQAALERLMWELRAMPEGSDGWTFGVCLSAWGIRGVADACQVDDELVKTWLRQGVVPQPHRTSVRTLWRDLAGRGVGWGGTSQRKTGRRREVGRG
jgi:hypothetical protein